MNIKDELKKLTDAQYFTFAKIHECARRYRSGQDSAFDYSIVEYHLNKGCKLLQYSKEEEEFYILDYVKNNF